MNETQITEVPEKKKGSSIKIYIIVTAIISFLSCAIGGYGVYYLLVEKEVLSQTVINKLEREVTVNENGIADAVEKLYDAVVVVSAYRDATAIAGGTGFVYKIEGNRAYIITNQHVIEGSNKATVTFTSEEEIDAKLHGSDEYSDIAVLSVDADEIISVAELGSSNDARNGDTLFAIGAPLAASYSWTVTRGILSGKDRMVDINIGSTGGASNWTMRVLQTDTAINSGNSGGPLANSNGQVIGVTNMKLVSSGVEGMGFAIPIEDALRAASELVEHGVIRRPVLGITPLDINNSELRYRYNINLDSSITSGAVVVAVNPGSVADEIGLRVGDVIVKLGDHDIANSARLRYHLFGFSVGESTSIVVIRGTSRETINLTLSQSAN